MTALKPAQRARDIMTHHPVCVDRSTTLRQFARILEQHKISGTPVVDRQQRVIGIVSNTDLIRRCSEGTVNVPPAYLVEALGDRTDRGNDVIPESLVCVQDFMTADPLTVSPDAPAADVARLMFHGRFHRVVVVDESHRPIGIITSLDLLGAFPSQGAAEESATSWAEI